MIKAAHKAAFFCVGITQLFQAYFTHRMSAIAANGNAYSCVNLYVI